MAWKKRILKGLLTVFLFVIALGTAGAQDVMPESEEVPPAEYYKARVLAVTDKGHQKIGPRMTIEKQKVKVEVTSGQFAGQILEIEHSKGTSPAFDIDVKPGDEVLLLAEIQDNQITQAYIDSYARDRHLIYLAITFLVVLVVLGKFKGFKAVITLIFTLLALVKVMLPLMLKGYNPLILAVLISAAVSTFSLVVIAGANRKTLSAIIGTTGGVLVAGILAYGFGTVARLNGFGGEETAMLMYIPQGTNFNFRGLLFAGIIISALGAVMDVGMSVASAMEEIKRANPAISALALMRSGMNVGRDVMGTMSNTLILVYIGEALPLLLLFMAYNTPLVRIVNLELIATEIVRALAGSIGLLLAIPISAVTGGYLLSRK